MAEVDRLDSWLRKMVDLGAADLFLVEGFPPAVRLNGTVTPLDEDPLHGVDIESEILAVLHPAALHNYRTTGSTDISLRRGDLGRFRLNLHRERGRPAATIRALPATPPQGSPT